MNGKQRAVLWIGLILVAFNLVRKWSEISSIIFAGAGSSASSGTQPPSTNNGGNSITIPIPPIVPGVPKITIPIPKL